MFDLTLRRLGVLLVLTISIVFSFSNPNEEIQGRNSSFSFSSFQERRKIQEEQRQNYLEYDYYHETCPQAEQIIRTTMEELYQANSNISPQLLRLLFHDCFVGGCDASVLLDENDDGTAGIEKNSDPDKTLKGFAEIERIKSRLEEACPATVSCSDILVLATREGVLLAGGPYYPLFTGRKDSSKTHPNDTDHIPNPNGNISDIKKSFRKKGFNEKETVSLLGAHSIGKIDCIFIGDRLTNFSGTGLPDPSIEPAFLDQLRNTCTVRAPNVTGLVAMYLHGLASMPAGYGFDTHYYQNLLIGRGLLVSDQELMADEKTAAIVSDFASDDGSVFRKNFAQAMVKLSDLDVLSGSQGFVRMNCSKLLPQLVS